MSLVSISEGSVQLGHFRLNIPNFEINAGVTRISGPNGAGKSTLIRLVLGLTDLKMGVREIGEISQFGYVPQNYRVSLMPWMSAKENAQLIDKSNQPLETLDAFNFPKSDQLNRPSKLSGGQCQRVAIARELINCHDLVMMDEPFSSLDTDAIESVALKICQFVDMGKSVGIISHLDLPNVLKQRLTQEYSIIRDTETSAVVKPI